MYEHYERLRTDNITDPVQRRAHPISTISGWDQSPDTTIVAGTMDSSTITTASVGTQKLDAIEASTTSAAYTNGINKGEQTDDDEDMHTIDMDVGVKCACEEEEQKQQQQQHVAVGSDTDTAEPMANKNVSSISSISDVYNKQINAEVKCNGTSHEELSVGEDSVLASPDKQPSSGQVILKKALEVRGYDEENDNPKEIVEEIIEEILQKSEEMLTDCQKESIEAANQLEQSRTSPVIKDDEIEMAVNEVVKGVKEVEAKAKRDSELQQTTSTSTSTTATDAPIDANKTELLSSSARFTNNNETSVMTITTVQTSEAVANNNTDDEATATKEMITTIVNEVIDNSIDQHAAATMNDNEPKCDNNNSVPATPVENETNEEIAKALVNEIIDNCFRNDEENNNDNINNNGLTTGPITVAVQTPIISPAKAVVVQEVLPEESSTVIEPESPVSLASPLSIASPAKSTTEQSDAGSSGETVVDVEEVVNVPIPQPQRRSFSASTSTQVETNHFGEIYCCCPQIPYTHLLFPFFFQMQRHQLQISNISLHTSINSSVQKWAHSGPCLVQDQQDHRFGYPSLSGHISINDCYPTCCSLWKPTFRFFFSSVCLCWKRSERPFLTGMAKPFHQERTGLCQFSRERNFRRQHRTSYITTCWQSDNSLWRLVATAGKRHVTECKCPRVKKKVGIFNFFF